MKKHEAKHKLTDKDVEVITDALKENREKVEEARPTVLHVDHANQESKTVMVTGTFNEVGALVEIEPVVEREGLIHNDALSGEEIEISEEQVSEEFKSIAGELGMTEEDTVQLFNVMMAYHKDSKYPVYTNLPAPYKKMVDSIALSSGPRISAAEKGKVAKMMVENLYEDVMSNQAIVDLENTIKDELNVDSMMTEFGKDMKKMMEVDLLARASELEKASHHEENKEAKEKLKKKANQMREISKSFTEAYTLQPLKIALEEGVIRRLDKKVRHLKGLIESFDFKYKESKFGINSITLIRPVLIRVFMDYEVETIDEFIALICEYTKNMDADNPVDHTLMYYTIKNILSLNYILEEDEFARELISNIKSTLDLIKLKGGKNECHSTI